MYIENIFAMRLNVAEHIAIDSCRPIHEPPIWRCRLESLPKTKKERLFSPTSQVNPKLRTFSNTIISEALILLQKRKKDGETQQTCGPRPLQIPCRATLHQRLL